MGILSQNQKKERWEEPIELNRLTPETPPNIQAANTNLPIDGNKPSKTKIKRAITTLEKQQGLVRKQQKPSRLTQRQLLTNVHNLIKRIYEEENILEELKESILIMLSKKEDLRNCNTTKELCFC